MQVTPQSRFREAGYAGRLAPWAAPAVAERFASRLGGESDELIAAAHAGLRERAREAVRLDLDAMVSTWHADGKGGYVEFPADPANADPRGLIETAAQAADLDPEELVKIVREVAPAACADERPRDLLYYAEQALHEFQRVPARRGDPIFDLPAEEIDRRFLIEIAAPAAARGKLDGEIRRLAAASAWRLVSGCGWRALAEQGLADSVRLGAPDVWEIVMQDREEWIELQERYTPRPRLVTVDGNPVTPVPLDKSAQTDALREQAEALGMRLTTNAEPGRGEPEAPEALPLTSADTLADLTDVPGLVGEIVDWMESSSDRPNRALLLGAALTFVATLAGRRFASPTNLRTNLYLVTLAPSGHGKDHALQQIKALAAAAGLDKYVGPARLMSASALRKLVKREPSVGCFIDEFGGFMHQIHDRRAGIHNTMIRNDMLEMFSAAGTFFAGAEYAGEEATKVYAPNFSISGTSTPAQFWSSLSSMSAVDGLLARLILLDVSGPKPKRRKAPAAPGDVPAKLIDALRRLAGAGGNLAGIGGAPTPRTVALDADAERVLEAITDELDAAEVLADEDALPFLNRIREHAIKLALTVAVGVNCEAPAITGPVMEWAGRLAKLSAATLMRESADRIADNDREAAVNRILSLIRKAGGEGINPGVITDKTRGVDTRLRTQILADLVEAGRVRFERQATRGRARERYIAT